MEGFKFTIPYRVRIADVNYGNHVANSAVLNFFQDARIAYLDNLGGYSELDLGGGCGIILPSCFLHCFGSKQEASEFCVSADR